MHSCRGCPDAGCVLAAGAAAGVRSTSVQDVMRRLLQRKNVMVRPPGPAAAVREAKYIAAIDILQVLVCLHTALAQCEMPRCWM